MKLADWMKANNKRNLDLVDALESTHNQVWMWKVGRIFPKREKMRKIFDMTGGKVTPNDFYGFGEVP